MTYIDRIARKLETLLAEPGELGVKLRDEGQKLLRIKPGILRMLRPLQLPP